MRHEYYKSLKGISDDMREYRRIINSMKEKLIDGGIPDMNSSGEMVRALSVVGSIEKLDDIETKIEQSAMAIDKCIINSMKETGEIENGL